MIKPKESYDLKEVLDSLYGYQLRGGALGDAISWFVSELAKKHKYKTNKLSSHDKDHIYQESIAAGLRSLLKHPKSDNLKKFGSVSSLFSYFHRIIGNEETSWLKRRSKRKDKPSSEDFDFNILEGQLEMRDEILEDAEVRSQLRSLLNEVLSDRTSETSKDVLLHAFYLYIVKGWTWEDIGQELDRSGDSLKTTYSRFKKRLQEQYPNRSYRGR